MSEREFKRHVATFEVSFFARDMDDAAQIASELRDAIWIDVCGSGQSNVRVTSVKPEFSHDQCKEFGICLCNERR